MAKTVEIRLSEAQHAALTAAASAAGIKFFDYCRGELLARVTVAPERVHASAPEPSVVERPASRSIDRMDRLEAMVASLAASVNALAGAPAVQEEPQVAADIDMDDVVAQSLNEVVVEERSPPEQGNGVRHVGTRPRMPLTGPAPAHLRGL